MNYKPIPPAIALAAALLGAAPMAAAAALGEIAAVSALGERFRAEVLLPGGTAADAECYRVGAASSADIPVLQRGQVTISGSGVHARLIVRAGERINDPVLRLALENVCESRLRREYTLLMPFAQAAERPSAAKLASPSSAPAAKSRPSTPRSTAASPATATRQAARPTERAMNMTGDESLASLAKSLYPEDDAARARFTAAAAAANPKLFPDANSLTRTLPAGTALRMPDLRAQRAPASPSATAPAVAPATAANPDTGHDRLMVDKGNLARAPETVGPGTAQAQGFAERERALAKAIDRSIIAEMELLARIKELEEIQAGLQERIRKATSGPMVTAPSTPPHAPGVVAATVAAAAPAAAQPAAAGRGLDAYLFGALGLAALLLVTLLRGARSRNSDTRTTKTPPTATATLLDLGESRKGRANAEEDGFSSAATMGTPGAGPDWPAPPESAPVEEHKSAVELADIMMSFGRVKGAADTLAEFIRGNPREAVTPWLKLLEVYRAADLRTEFDAIAGELNKTFNVTAVSWQNYDALRASRMSIEDLPHISEPLQKSWRTAACQRYLQQLLRDNRNGTRTGFPFAVIDEILTLSAILEEELGPCLPPDAMRTQR